MVRQVHTPMDVNLGVLRVHEYFMRNRFDYSITIFAYD